MNTFHQLKKEEDLNLDFKLKRKKYLTLLIPCTMLSGESVFAQ